MKKYIALIVIETMVLSFCGCSMITNRVKKLFNSDDNSLLQSVGNELQKIELAFK